MGLLDQKIAVITGGAQGIGLGICSAYIREGAKVVLADVKFAAAESAARELGESAYPIQMDVSDKSSVVQAVNTIWNDIGPIDVWVNNAGLSDGTPIPDITEEAWSRMLDVNLKGQFLCCQAVLGKMKERRCGKFVNIASLGGERGGKYAGIHYSASKGGVIAMTKVIAANAAEYGITANAITPGYISTPMGDRIFAGNKQKYIDQIPLGRMGLPEDVANVAVFLASYLSDYVTGDVIKVNGGIYM